MTFDAALRHHQSGRLLEAERLYARILESDPRHIDALHLLGVLAHQTGRHEEALRSIGKAIAENPRLPAFHNNLGNALKALGRRPEADAAYQRAAALDPSYVEAHYNRGLMHQEQGRLDQAIECYGRVLAHRPAHAEALNNLGNALQRQGKLAEALDAYGRALHARPAFATAHNNIGNVLRAQGDSAAAIESYTRALSHDARHAEALRNLGIALLDESRLEESAAALRRSLAINPRDAATHLSLGNTLRQQGHAQDAADCYRRALELDGDCGEAALGLATAAIPVIVADQAAGAAAVADFDRALDRLAAWDRDHPGRLGVALGSHQPFYLAYRDSDVSAPLARFGDLASAAAAACLDPPPAPRRTPAARIRVVVVSGQVRRHPVWDIILRGVLAHLDRKRFEIHLYHTGSRRDAETTWAQEHVDRFVQGPKPLRFWIEQIAADRPEVIWYPEIGMDPIASALAALRLAGLQMASWGHPVTTGLPTIDYYLSGELLEGPGADRHYRERLIRLPGTGVCTEAPSVQAAPWRPVNAAQDVVRFAICQQPMKFDPAHDALLARIAAATGACEFWLPSPLNLPWASARLHDRLGAAFLRAGLDPRAHLRTLPWLPQDRFLGFLDSMDVYLDCPAFSGYTTAWQALHRGLPVVTLDGRFLRQRLAAGLLRQLGLTEGLTESQRGYVERAVEYARRSREPKAGKHRQAIMRAASAKADGNVRAVRALERLLLETLRP